MPQLTLFISCVSNEFGTYRDAIRKDLTRPNITTKIQEDFVAYGGSTLQKLDDYIQQCNAVIHICGNMTGSMANTLSLEYINNTHKDFKDRFPELVLLLEGKEELSYTQWEAWLAAYHKKVLIIATPGQNTARSESYQLVVEQQQHQLSHLKRLQAHGHYDEIHFSTTDELIKKLYQSTLLELLRKVPSSKSINLPYQSIGKLFKGREKDIERIHNEFHKSHYKPTAIVGNTIYGLGGIGKTRLAIEYARRHEQDYTALLFVGADSPETLFSNLAALSAKPVLDLPEQVLQEEQVKYDAVIQWLNQYPGWLLILILDDVDNKPAATTVEALFGKLQGGHVLITSRRSEWSSQVKSLDIDVLNQEAATSFLIERTQEKRRKTPEDESLAKLIAADLGHLALALEQAGAYINTRRLKLSQYRQSWQQNRALIMEWYDPQLMLYPSSVAITWQTSINQLSASAINLLNMLAWLAPDPIPESLLDKQFDQDSDFDTYAALSELAGFSLVSRMGEPQFTVHRLVQDITRRKQNKALVDKTLLTCLNWINEAFLGDPSDIRSWPVLEPLTPHALSLLNVTESQIVNTSSGGRLLNQIGLIYLNKAQYREAEPLMRRALEIDEQSFGANHPKVARGMNNLAQLLKDTNRLVEAEPLMRRALEIDEQSFGANHPNVAIRLNNLAALLKATNRLVEAEPLMRRALEIDEQSFGANHPNVAIRLNNLAQLLKDTNRLVEAEPLMRRALEIDEQNFGANHYKVARGMNNLAQLLKDTNRLVEAEPLMRRALEIDEQNFGANHYKVAIRLNNLAVLLQATNRLVEAEPQMHRALDILIASYGDDHRHTQIVNDNYLQLLQMMGNSKDEIEILF